MTLNVLIFKTVKIRSYEAGLYFKDGEFKGILGVFFVHVVMDAAHPLGTGVFGYIETAVVRVRFNAV